MATTSTSSPWDHSSATARGGGSLKPEALQSVEASVQLTKKSNERIQRYVEQQAAMSLQEQVIVDEKKDMVQAGRISEDEAHRLQARARMHEKERTVSTGAISLDGAVAAGAQYETTEAILEQLLNNDSHYWIVRVLKSHFRIYELERFILKEELRRKSASFRHPFPCLNRLVNTWHHGKVFEVALGCVMMANGMLIGVSTSISGENAGTDELFEYVEHAFTGVFVLEIVLRLMACGWLWLTGFMNLVDLALIILTGVLPMWILGPLGIESSSVRTLQVLRVLRLVRVVRMVRSIKLFRILWDLIQGIMDCGRTLLWTYVVLGGVLYIASVLSLLFIGWLDVFKDDEYAQTYFGTLGHAYVTLFQTITLDSWTGMARPLMGKSWTVVVFLVLCIMIMTLCLLNLITAVIVNNAFSRKLQDLELQATMQQEKTKEDIKHLKSVFAEIDEDGSGTLSKAEYDEAVKGNEEIMTQLSLLNIPPEETDSIWLLLDDGSGEVKVDDFCKTLRALEGPALAKSSFTIVQTVKKVNKRIEKLRLRCRYGQVALHQLQEKLDKLNGDVAGLLGEVKAFMVHIGECIPASPHARGPQELSDRREALFAKQKARLEAAQADMVLPNAVQ